MSSTGAPKLAGWIATVSCEFPEFIECRKGVGRYTLTMVS